MFILHGKLHHTTPGWVSPGARFHIRIRTEAGSRTDLTRVPLAQSLLDSISQYHVMCRWYTWLAVLMPDHLHLLLSFQDDRPMAKVVAGWKRFHARQHGVDWQENFFDHRLRNDDEYIEKAAYLRMNPVRAGLCASPEKWPWTVEPWKQSYE